MYGIQADDRNFNITGADLYDLFGKYGPIRQVRVGTSSELKTKGTAYVVYESPDDAKEAINHLNGFHLMERYIVGEWARWARRRVEGRWEGCDQEGMREGGMEGRREGPDEGVQQERWSCNKGNKAQMGTEGVRLPCPPWTALNPADTSPLPPAIKTAGVASRQGRDSRARAGAGSREDPVGHDGLDQYCWAVKSTAGIEWHHVLVGIPSCARQREELQRVHEAVGRVLGNITALD